MIRPLRARHRLVFVALALLVPLVLWAALSARPAPERFFETTPPTVLDASRLPAAPAEGVDP